MTKRPQISIENVNCPGQTSRVDAEKYSAMREVVLRVLPTAPPGLSQSQIRDAIQPYLPQQLWPEGKKSMWWFKAVQLDLEAKQVITRTKAKPLTWHRL